MSISDLVNNAWTVGVGGGVLSGVLVTLLSRFILSKRDDREYLQKIIGANREVVYAIRPGISEGQIPTSAVLEALINSTSRRYGVMAADLYTPAQISEELIREVMDSSFISSAKKAEYCSQLAQLTKTVPPEVQTFRPVERPEPNTVAAYRTRAILYMSATAGLLTASMITAVTFLRVRDSSMFEAISNNGAPKIYEVLVITITATMTVALMFFVMIWRQRERAIEREKELVAQKRFTKNMSGLPLHDGDG